MAHAQLQWFPDGGGCLRVWDSDAGQLGDPYDWACAVAIHDDGSVTLHGVTVPLTPDRDRAIRRCLVANGIHAVRYERRNAGRVRNITRYLRSP